MASELIRCAFTEERVEVCGCGRHQSTYDRSRPVPAGLSTSRRTGVRQFGVVQYDEHAWTIHDVECHAYRAMGTLKRLIVDLDAPPPKSGASPWGSVRDVHICMSCQPVSESEVTAWQRKFLGRR